MRKAMLFFALFALADSLWAADPIIGTWKQKSAKSKGTELPPDPRFKEITATYREIGRNRIEMSYTVIGADGTSDTDVCTYPAHRPSRWSTRALSRSVNALPAHQLQLAVAFIDVDD